MVVVRSEQSVFVYEWKQKQKIKLQFSAGEHNYFLFEFHTFWRSIRNVHLLFIKYTSCCKKKNILLSFLYSDIWLLSQCSLYGTLCIEHINFGKKKFFLRLTLNEILDLLEQSDDDDIDNVDIFAIPPLETADMIRIAIQMLVMMSMKVCFIILDQGFLKPRQLFSVVTLPTMILTVKMICLSRFTCRKSVL